MRRKSRRVDKVSTVEEKDSGSFLEQAAEIYDRQLRLWGHKAQARLSKSRVLIAVLPGATSTALWFELAKNLILAGVGCLLVSNAASETSRKMDLADTERGNQKKECSESLSARSAYEEAKCLNPFVAVEEGPSLESLLQSSRCIQELELDAVCVVAPVLKDVGTVRTHGPVGMTICELVSKMCTEANVSCYIAASIGYFGAFFISQSRPNAQRGADTTNVLFENKMGTRLSCSGIERSKDHVQRRENTGHRQLGVSSYANIMGHLRSSSFLMAEGRSPSRNHRWEPFATWQALRSYTQNSELSRLWDSNAKDSTGSSHDALRFHLHLAEYWRDSFPPVAKVLGGTWALEVIKNLADIDGAGRLYDFFYFDGLTSRGTFICLDIEDISAGATTPEPKTIASL